MNKHTIPLCLYNRVWHQITHDSNTGLPRLQQPLTSIHIFNIKETEPEPKEESSSSDSEPAEEDKDSDNELIKQTGELHIDDQIRGTEIPKELTP